MLLLYSSIFVSRQIYNCEAWSNITMNPDDERYCIANGFSNILLRRVVEIPSSVPHVVLFLEPGILPINFEIDVRQQLFLKPILDRDQDYPVT